MPKHPTISGGLFALFLPLLLPFALHSVLFAGHSPQADSIKFVIHISVDGLRPDAVTVLGPDRAPNFYRLRTEGAFTDNARTDIDFTSTLPNHADILTGRLVLGGDGHSVTFNSTHPGTFESVHGSVAGVFDVAHDNGLRTGLYYSKDKFAFYARSWDSVHGQEDTVGIDNGRAKIDRVLFRDNTESLTTKWLGEMSSEPFQYSFIHYRDPDSDGHARGWMSSLYLDGVADIDGYLGQIFDLVENDSTLAGKTAIVVTADHGGSSTNHNTPGEPLHFTIPLYVWGPGVDAGADLYELNWDTRQSYCRIEPGKSAAVAPIRNGGSGNLALALLGLPAIPGSTINKAQDLAHSLPEGVVLPEVSFLTPTSNESFRAGEPISFEAIPTAGSAGVANVVFEIGCDTVGTASEPPYAVDWSTSPPGSHIARATVADTEGRFSSDTVSVTIVAAISVDGSDSDWISLGIDPVLDTDGLQTDPELALERLLFYEDSASYFFAFDAGAVSRRVAFGLYLDVDAARGEQMTDPLGHAVRGSRQHTPEVVFYFVHDDQGGWSDGSPSFFRLEPGSDEWPIPGWPSTFDFAADTANRFLEFSFPKDVVTEYPGSEGIFAELFTVGETEGAGASESVPSDEGIAFTEENTSTETTILSTFHNFNFPDFDGEKIKIDGNRFDWLRSGIIPAVNTDKLQSEPELALDRLFVTHDLDDYYFAFISTPGPKPVTFGLYIDSGDHSDPAAGPGGPGSANGSAVEAEGFLPDVQIYFDNDTSGTWTEDTPRYFIWNNTDGTWGAASKNASGLPDGSEFATGLFGKTSWVEFSIPREALGLYDTELMDMQLFTVGSTPGAGASAALPSDPNIQFTVENASTDVTVLSSPYLYSTRPIVVHAERSEELPAAARLFQNYPNPVSTTTTVSFTVDRSQHVRLAAYDLLGRLQVVLFDQLTSPGTQRIVLDASRLASGTYILWLEADGLGASRKMVVVR